MGSLNMKVKLLKTHHHAGKLYLRDDVLEVESETAHWLVEHGVAEHVSTKVEIQKSSDETILTQSKSKKSTHIKQEQENA